MVHMLKTSILIYHGKRFIVISSLISVCLCFTRTDIPTKITVLKSEIRPEQCGDTEFINTHAAYDDLSEEMKTKLKGLTARYCYLKLREIKEENGEADNLQEEEVNKAKKCAIHPLITTHPITGMKNIYANPSHTALIHGLSFTESDELLQQIFQHTAQQQFIYRHRYDDYDVILWDNRG
jgi:taurine dioxygenase